ncbi:NGG1-interacting factor 3 [Candida viswanathii]|uniref:NGG1-interacting factor 3 n=1 Tax=Candida viswanathii TaxID=5486 RepID=A0A367XR54_9ASCO|nr:NGG1-interacting factor 3 [Candida viswanathii]
MDLPRLLPGSSNTYCLKIPQLGGNTNFDLVGVLNILKLIVKISKVNKVFIGSHDGFTGSTIWLVLLTQLLNKIIIEESVLYLALQNVKLFFFDQDYSLLQDLEIFADYLNKHLYLEFYYLNPIVKPQPYDWFTNCQGQLNLPSKVYPNVYLGSLMHSSSSTIIDTYGITHIISIDELPSWWNKHMSKCVQFDYEQNPTADIVLKSIYKYDNTKIYEVNFDQLARSIPRKVRSMIPSSIKSLVFIYNFKDDGKDSILPMLLDAPPFIHEKILLGQAPQNPTLIHCKVGVSRSATLVIASIMKHFRSGWVFNHHVVDSDNINVYSPHTAVDSAKGGVNDFLVDGITKGYKVESSEPIEQDSNEPECGMGRLVKLEKPAGLQDLVANVKLLLSLKHVQVATPSKDKQVSTIAICAGSGGGVFKNVKADLYYTGELSHHEALFLKNWARLSSAVTTQTQRERS